MRRKHDTVNGNCLCDTPDPSSSRRLFSPSRDYRPPPSRDSRQSRVLSTLHANPRRWLLNGYSQPDRQAHTMATTQASMIRVSTHPQDIVQKTEGQSALPAFCFCKGHCTRRDAGVSAEGGSNSGRGNSGRGRDLPIDARTVVPPDLSSTSLFMGIMFNPITSTPLASTVKRVTTLANARPSPNTLHSILEGAGGDVRNEIMTLEFTTCARPKSWRQSGKNTTNSIRLLYLTQKENMGPVSNLTSPADMTGQLSENGSSSPGGNLSPSPMAKNGKPTSTNGSGSGPGRQG